MLEQQSNKSFWIVLAGFAIMIAGIFLFAFLSASCSTKAQTPYYGVRDSVRYVFRVAEPKPPEIYWMNDYAEEIEPGWGAIESRYIRWYASYSTYFIISDSLTAELGFHENGTIVWRLIEK